ncbi:T9SS type A sorting domain-containing protein [uncultured Kordia sp.]|uniref:T9SS type A sorting domain-containing protein n=1 Tax=uncultured Kordia sp. TaxID=507699 RepID=UPI002610EFD6|nr:T9SS type A sorting domain-containing protein [uncultured Kordia sp.]
MKKILFLIFLTPIALFAQIHEESRIYEYDNLNRLVKVVYYSGIVYEYNYDNLGNRLGRTIDVELPYNNYSINAIGLTCINSNDGIITIEALRRNKYVARLVGSDNNVDETITANPINNWELQFENLDSGEYYLYITIQDIPESTYQKTFILNIDEPELLDVDATWNGNDSGANRYAVNINAGTAPYTVRINNEIILNTNDSEFSFDVNHGDLVEISTAKACEGTFSKTISILDTVTLYPNPTRDKVHFSIPKIENITSINVELYDLSGRLIGVFTPTIKNKQIEISIQHLPSGVYVATFPTLGDKTFKIIKE